MGQGTWPGYDPRPVRLSGKVAQVAQQKVRNETSSIKSSPIYYAREDGGHLGHNDETEGAMRLTIDIETLPALGWGDEDKLRWAYRKVPKSYKKPESIAKWVQDNAEEQWRRTSFDPVHAVVWMVGLAVGDEAPFVLIAKDPAHDPGECLRGLAEFFGGLDYMPRAIVGKYHRKFDLPLLAVQAFLHGQHRLGCYLADVLSYPYDKRVQDVGERWPGGPISLDPLARVLGVTGKPDGMDGSKVYDAYLAGREAEVAAYCGADVESARACWDVLTGRYMGELRAPERPGVPEIPAAIRDHLK